jgi:hypothetical protein
MGKSHVDEISHAQAQVALAILIQWLAKAYRESQLSFQSVLDTTSLPQLYAIATCRINKSEAVLRTFPWLLMAVQLDLAARLSREVIGARQLRCVLRLVGTFHHAPQVSQERRDLQSTVLGLAKLLYEDSGQKHAVALCFRP